MCAAIEWGERRIDGAPAGRADLTLDQSATFGKYEIRTGTATFVTLRVVLIPRGGLRQFLLILRLNPHNGRQPLRTLMVKTPRNRLASSTGLETA